MPAHRVKTSDKVSDARRHVKAANGYVQLITTISANNTRMVGRVATVANQTLVLRNCMVGTRYLAALPSAEQLKAFLERERDEIGETLAADIPEC